MRNMTWVIAQSPVGRSLMPSAAETGFGPEGVLRNNSAFNMYCSPDPTKPSPLFTIYNATIYYNTLKALIPARYRVCAEYRPVCEKTPFQKCNMYDRIAAPSTMEFICTNTKVS